MAENIRPIGSQFDLCFGDGTLITYKVVGHVEISDFGGARIAEEVSAVRIVVGDIALTHSDLSPGDVYERKES